MGFFIRGGAETMNGRFDFQYLKRTVSIADVLADKGLLERFRSRGDKLTGPCPVHDGDNPQAFTANLSKNIWYCFTGCADGGDVIKFVQKMDGKSCRQAAEYLSRLAGSASSPRTCSPPLKKPKSFQPFTRRLPLNPYSSLLRQKKIHPETARRFESGHWSGKGFLKDCVGVRLHDSKGGPLGYAGRRIDPTDIKRYGKWKFPSNFPKSSILYNYHRISPLKCGLVLVECPWGVMRLWQIGVPAAGLLGVNLSLQQFELLKSAPRIILMLDGDKAGGDAIMRIKENPDLRSRIHVFRLPDGLDPDDLPDDELKKVSSLFLS